MVGHVRAAWGHARLPGESTDNVFVESLNGEFQAEGLNATWFLSLDGAWRKCEAWWADYNTGRPQSALGYPPPAPETIATPSWPSESLVHREESRLRDD